ncbi:MAG: 16S rRNA (guanine(966)-N(2))-methyltransferase RsmD [Salaquimonas sp.]
MRIVGGKFRGRRLSTPSSDKIRPTTDRTRESLFNILGNQIDFEGKRVIDVFAGTGALGLEAMSRGCGYVLFVEESAEARGLLRTNVEALGLQGASRIFKRDATKIGEAGTITPFDLVFLDPPYGKQLGEQALAALVRGGWLSMDALIVLEERADCLPESLDGLSVLDTRIFGETGIMLLEPR